MYIKNVLNAMKSDFGKYLISIIIGIGFASLFRKACGDDKCYIFKGPSIDKIHNNIYIHYPDGCSIFKLLVIADFNEALFSCSNPKSRIRLIAFRYLLLHLLFQISHQLL